MTGMTDDDLLYRDLEEKQTAVGQALSDVEGIEQDALTGDWDEDGAVANATNATLTELNALHDALTERMRAVPPADSTKPAEPAEEPGSFETRS